MHVRAGTFGTNLNFEAIQEMAIYTAGVGAEYGRAHGGVVNVITKSGTNRYEGTVKYLFQNDNWNAQNTPRLGVDPGVFAEKTKERVADMEERFVLDLGSFDNRSHINVAVERPRSPAVRSNRLLCTFNEQRPAETFVSVVPRWDYSLALRRTDLGPSPRLPMSMS